MVFLPSLNLSNLTELCTDMGFYICNVCCVNGNVLLDELGLSNGALFIWIILLLNTGMSHFKLVRTFVILTFAA